MDYEKLKDTIFMDMEFHCKVKPPEVQSVVTEKETLEVYYEFRYKGDIYRSQQTIHLPGRRQQADIIFKLIKEDIEKCG